MFGWLFVEITLAQSQTRSNQARGSIDGVNAISMGQNPIDVLSVKLCLVSLHFNVCVVFCYVCIERGGGGRVDYWVSCICFFCLFLCFYGMLYVLGYVYGITVKTVEILQ